MLVGFQTGVAQHAADAAVAGGTALFAGDVAVFIYDDIDGIDLGVVHGGEVGVFRKDNGHRARVLRQVGLHRLVWFEDVYG